MSLTLAKTHVAAAQRAIEGLSGSALATVAGVHLRAAATALIGGDGGRFSAVDGIDFCAAVGRDVEGLIWGIVPAFVAGPGQIESAVRRGFGG